MFWENVDKWWANVGKLQDFGENFWQEKLQNQDHMGTLAVNIGENSDWMK